MNKKYFACLLAILAACFYALSSPISKILLNDVPVTLMASFLYLGAGIGISVIYLFTFKIEGEEERLRKNDLPYIIGMVLLDILAPILMMLGIKKGNASNASLLGNFEIVATTLIALLIFNEKVGKKLWIAIILITIASITLSFNGNETFEFSYGSLFVILATICWGLENNCTKNLSNKSTSQIVIIKGIFSGLGSLIVALILKESFPTFNKLIYVMLLGFVAYGLSIWTYVRAQRYIGAAKTSAFYALAPFIGAILSFFILKEKISLLYLVALVIMIVGTYFIIKDIIKNKEKNNE